MDDWLNSRFERQHSWRGLGIPLHSRVVDIGLWLGSTAGERQIEVRFEIDAKIIVEPVSRVSRALAAFQDDYHRLRSPPKREQEQETLLLLSTFELTNFMSQQFL